MNYSDSKIVYFDLETTGLNVYYEGIIEIGAITLYKGEELSKSWLISVNDPISEVIQRITGITNDLLQNEGMPIKNALRKFVKFVTKDVSLTTMIVLIGHNIFDFDKRFFLEELKDNRLFNLYRKVKKWVYVDTLYICQYITPDLSSYRLTNMCRFLGIKDFDRKNHRALSDAELVKSVMNAIKRKYNLNEVVYASHHVLYTQKCIDLIWPKEAIETKLIVE
jgi:DNA polymerase III alpha subunit (gram-positive type)